MAQANPSLQPGGFFPWLAQRIAHREANTANRNGALVVELESVVASRTAVGLLDGSTVLGLPAAMHEAYATVPWTHAQIDRAGFLVLHSDNLEPWDTESVGTSVFLTVWMPIATMLAAVLADAIEVRGELLIDALGEQGALSDRPTSAGGTLASVEASVREPGDPIPEFSRENRAS